MARALAPAIVRAADGLSRWTTRVLRVESTAGREELTESELRELVAANTALDPEERRIIGKALARGTATVREVMIPRTEVRFLQAGMSVEEALVAAREAGHSRYPVTDHGHDDIIGFVHLRDVVWHPRGSLRELARELKQLPGSKPVLAALSEMRREQHQIAVVMDEYGGTAGIVTLEDLIEELVGEIHDEYDVAPAPAPLSATLPAELPGMLNLNDFTERTGVQLPAGPYETVGGFIMSTLGRLPRAGDEVTWQPHADESYQLDVLALEGRRVARVRVSSRPPAPALVSGSQSETQLAGQPEAALGVEPAV